MPLRDGRHARHRGDHEVLPHRYPFLLVDRVLEVEPGQSRGGDQERERQRAVLPGTLARPADHAGRPDHRGHGPGRAACSIAATVERVGRVAMLASIDDVKLRRPVVPGDQLRLEITGRTDQAELGLASPGVARVGDAVAAEAKIRFVMIDADLAA